MQPCVLAGGERCVLCKEDIGLERKIQELPDMCGRLRMRMNASPDRSSSKISPEIATFIFSLSMEENDLGSLQNTLRKLPMQFLLGPSVGASTLNASALVHSCETGGRSLFSLHSDLSMTSYDYRAVLH